ncbi:30S ribosomal protein S16 [Candidatus Falkowbacteria bacterium]|jgi:small subunit ribosomal protein S16|nr:30S ribosomal protein S16 [Candidatus Falkowbacteria bacterium]MBT5502614.1 30S ribosomal protein S16 [Candidatus Falkowbacteria bacterium]MBT6574447.1 30S ribosomal protein S16 [Candidatus Falkowbacteria bacterium]MBT7348943.1 30S ribosomal protein S16 [Candidatus Falkowbacteria bacterium]MBT7500330.1 30S ribosomal protein S16 [Candidatus Falkowbacteria bacterium]
MLSIRFSRTGKKNYPSFRIIVLDKRKDPWGDFLENLGNYDPRTKKLNIKADRVKYWIEKGAQPSSTVHNLLVSQDIIQEKKVRVSRLSKKRTAKLADKQKEKAAKETATDVSTETVAKEEAPKEEVKTEEAPTDVSTEAVAKEEAPKEAAKTEAVEKDEDPKEETKVKEVTENKKAE